MIEMSVPNLQWVHSYLIAIFTDSKLRLADAIRNFKWGKLFGFDKINVNDFQILLINVTF